MAGVEGGVDGRRGADDEAGQGGQRRDDDSLGNSGRGKGSQDHGRHHTEHHATTAAATTATATATATTERNLTRHVAYDGQRGYLPTPQVGRPRTWAVRRSGRLGEGDWVDGFSLGRKSPRGECSLAEGVKEKSSWCSNEYVCQNIESKALFTSSRKVAVRTGYFAVEVLPHS